MRTVPFNRTPLVAQRTLIWCLACCVSVLRAPAAAAHNGRPENQPALDLSLLVWSPGWYVIVVAAFIAVVVMVAAFVPARRAANMDPLIALRRD